jgi:hypothetical protein
MSRLSRSCRSFFRHTTSASCSSDAYGDSPKEAASVTCEATNSNRIEGEGGVASGQDTAKLTATETTHS